MTLLLVLITLGLLGLAQPSALAVGSTDAPAAQRITVRPGETLWGIAGRIAPDADPRATIARIRELNDLPDSTVPAGRVLRVPVEH